MSSSIKLLRSLSKNIWRGGGTPEENGFEGVDHAHDPKAAEAVHLLRESLVHEGQLPEEFDDFHTLLRFLRMRAYDILKSKDSFLNCLRWREEFEVNKLAKEFNFKEYQEVLRCYPHGYHGVDKCGRPVYIERMGMIDLDALFHKTNLDRLVKHHVCEQEKTSHLRFPACTLAANKKIASTTAILDVSGVGTSSFSKPARHLFMEIQKIDSNYYPETLSSLFIVNAGTGFRILWKLLKSFIDPRTSAKIQVLGGNYKSNLLEVIDPSNLPSFLGGDCTCSAHGGCMFSDKGPWNDPEILQSLQSAQMKSEEYAGAVEEAWLSAQSSPEYRSGQCRKEGPHTLLSRSINQLEVTAAEAQNKIRAMEAALEETKQVLRTLSQQITDLRMQKSVVIPERC